MVTVAGFLNHQQFGSPFWRHEENVEAHSHPWLAYWRKDMVPIHIWYAISQNHQQWRPCFFCRELYINSHQSSYIKSFSPWFIDFSYWSLRCSEIKAMIRRLANTKTKHQQNASKQSPPCTSISSSSKRVPSNSLNRILLPPIIHPKNQQHSATKKGSHEWSMEIT